ncbi:MAG: C25 family cysteine peptidase, partial [Lentisphaerota bacterium]
QLGRIVWEDLNANGLLDAGEPGITNITVNLYDALTNFLGTTATDTNGVYAFTNLLPATYEAGFTAPAGYYFTWPNVGADPSINSKADPSTGMTVPVALAAGETNNNWNAGMYRLASMQGLAWSDTNKNGIYEPGESALSNVVVWLLATNSTVIGVVTTGVDGVYAFTNLFPMLYYVSATIDTNYHFSPENQGGPGDIDSNVDSTNGLSETFQIVSGEHKTNLNIGAYFDPYIPTLALLTGARSLISDGRAVVEWETASEVGSIGYQVYRVKDGQRVALSDLPIVALNSPRGGVYRLFDDGVKAGDAAAYLIEEITDTGEIRPFGPFTLTVGSAGANFTGLAEGAVEHKDDMPAFSSLRRKTSGLNTTLTHGNSIRIPVRASGVKFLGSQVISSQLNLPEWYAQRMIQLGQLALRNRGRQVIYVPSEDGKGLYFYGEAPESRFSLENIYWLSAGFNPTPGIADGGNPTPMAGATYYATSRFEEDRQAMPSMVSDPAQDMWIWAQIVAGNPSFSYKTVGFDAEGTAGYGEATLRLFLNGANEDQANPTNHHMEASLNGVRVGEDRWGGKTPRTVEMNFAATLLREQGNQLTIRGLLDSPTAISSFTLDRLELVYPRDYTSLNDHLEFTADSNAIISVEGFMSGDVNVFDITDPRFLRMVTRASVQDQNGTRTVSFRPSAADRHYIAFTLSGVETITDATPSISPSLTLPSNAADYIIIAPDELLEAAQALAEYRTATGLRVMIVKLSDIYTSFNQGIADPSAIRAFLSFAWANWSTPPAYAVLLGSGTYDYRNLMKKNDNLVPPMLIGTPQGLFASDSIYGDVEGDDGVPEIAVGRLPMLDAPGIQSWLAKLAAFEGSQGEAWSCDMLLMADNPDAGGDFTGVSESIAALAPAGQVMQRAFLGTQTLAQARATALGTLNAGVRWANYVGHGGMDRLASEGLLTTADIAGLTNAARPSVLLAMTCVVGQYAVPGYDALAEKLLGASHGGMVAVWSPSGLSMNESAAILNRALAGAIYSAEATTLGEAIRQALETGRDQHVDLYLLRIYNLMGDPATRIAP